MGQTCVFRQSFVNLTGLTVFPSSPSRFLQIFIFENNIYYRATVESRAIRLVATGREGVVFNGLADWLYEGETTLTSTFDLDSSPTRCIPRPWMNRPCVVPSQHLCRLSSQQRPPRRGLLVCVEVLGMRLHTQQMFRSTVSSGFFWRPPPSLQMCVFHGRHHDSPLHGRRPARVQT